MAVWLKENLPEYYVVGCGRGEDLAGEAMVIAYRKKPLSDREPRNLLAVADPYVPGSRYAVQSVCPRTATDAVFQDLESGKVFRVINTHLDHEGSEARKLGLEQILAHLDEKKTLW